MKIKYQELGQLLKKDALTTDNTFLYSLISSLSVLSINETSNLGNIDSLRDYYTRLRRQKRTHMIKHDNELLYMYQNTYDGERFLNVDTGINNESRILVFYSKEIVLLAKRTNCILAYGTFKSAPRGFSQLFVVHIFFLIKESR
ncbi:hypothetical protein DMUE_4523 [Dictyocoela muelleri]|nr:hypothetical protein DMUE_4523 [Dictyocoela muelleri]